MPASSENQSSASPGRKDKPLTTQRNGSRRGSSEGFNFTKNIPDRYSIKETDDGERVLTCFESPNVQVTIERGQVASASAARRAGPGTIYLDGAAQGTPFLEHEKLIYNLDHHEGVIRAFTLSTCEQAMVMLLKGLDLRKHEWRIVANDPDLDTVFAIWILLNHIRLKGPNPRVRKAIIPLLRLEGAIDAHGLEFVEFLGFPEEQLGRITKTLEGLRDAELAVKKQGSWQEIDFLDYTADMLRRIDQIAYRSGEFSGFQEIEEVVQMPVYQNRIAVVCRSDAGIYETEQQLKKLYGTRLALILLQKGNEHYTIRQTDLFLPGNLEQVYEMLNIYDPAVTGRRPQNRWGGSTDIGGSPRSGGTRLSPREILEAVAETLQKPGWMFFATNAARAFGWAAAATAAGWLARWFWPALTSAAWPGTLANPSFGFLLGSLSVVTAALWMQLRESRNPRYFGLHPPCGWDWIPLVFAAVLFGAAGGAFAPWIEPDKRTTLSAVVHVLFLPLAAELIFRSLLHGLLIRGHHVQTRGSRWFLSWPVLVSGAAYAAIFVLPYSPMVSVVTLAIPDTLQVIAVRVAAAFLFGVTQGMIRERSESIFTPYIAHIVAALTVLVLYRLYPMP